MLDARRCLESVPRISLESQPHREAANHERWAWHSWFDEGLIDVDNIIGGTSKEASAMNDLARARRELAAQGLADQVAVFDAYAEKHLAAIMRVLDREEPEYAG